MDLAPAAGDGPRHRRAATPRRLPPASGSLTNGHILLEGVPGLAKTLALKTLAGSIHGARFGRIQFTPDMLPSDITGTTIYHAHSATFQVKQGPVFANLVLADEINRAPAKVQSALLEAMQERQVTLGDSTLALPDPFLVLATQNPLEQEGTYPLPEAQIDRFMLKVVVTYPSVAEERAILDAMAVSEPRLDRLARRHAGRDRASARRVVDEVYVDDADPRLHRAHRRRHARARRVRRPHRRAGARRRVPARRPSR